MNRVLSFRHPLRALIVSNPTLPIPFSPLFQSDPFKQRLMNCEIHKDKPGVSSLSTFTKDLRPMTYDEAHTLIQLVPQWNLVNEGDVLKLRRSWKVKNLTKGLEFFKRILDHAVAGGQCPNLLRGRWNLFRPNVTIEIWTRAVGGLTENDFIRAAKIDELNLDDLLRRW